jgi:NAD(P)-dependent dehydrogenase (short-subunit alcohol dehydrogenase family)
MQSAFRPDLFDGKTVLVTGGATGIGYGISEAFVRHGARVVLLSRKEEKLQEACKRLDALGRAPTCYHVADVRDADRVEVIAERMFSEGGVDVLVNGAAGNFVTPFAGMSKNAWTSVIDIVLNGTANLSRSFGNRMFDAQKGDASVINIVAGYAWTGAPLVSHSGAAKAGVLNLTRSLAVEWAPHVRCNAVSPGPIAGTEGVKRLAEDVGLGDAMKETVPLRRLGTPSEIGDACLFLASPAAAYVTGVCLPVDGGQDAWGPFGSLFQRMQG